MRRATDLLAAELRKAVTLPAVGIGVLVTLLGSVAITLVNALASRSALGTGSDGSAFENAFGAAPVGTVGAVLIGVVVIGSEYTASAAVDGGGRQITSTLTAAPHRVRLLAAKAGTTALVVLLSAAVTLPATVLVARAVLGGAPETVAPGDAVLRVLGAAAYWVLTALIAGAITTLTRSGIVPLIVLIVNSTVVSVSYLLTRLTPLAHWLPDMAGRWLLAGIDTVPGGLAVLPGALVMVGWTVALLVVAALVLHRRDA